jgi:hypothetical protein
MQCQQCEATVPAGTFCGVCGAATAPTRWGPAWLRLAAYTAAPDQHALWPSLATSLFPQAARRSRVAFRAALLALVVLLFAVAALRWQPPLIGLCALGAPLLFGLYLRETDAFRDQSIGALAGTAALGVGLGVGWAFLTDAIWKRTYDDVLGTPMTHTEQVINLAAIPVVGVLLMLAPVVVVRLLSRGDRESLDGFVIGAIGALCFFSADLLARAAPEFTHGLSDHDMPLDAVFALTALRGVAGPLTAVAVGGMVGATMWFTRREQSTRAPHWYSPSSPIPALVVALLLYAAQNGIDYTWLSYLQIVLLNFAIALAALWALRLVVHVTLLLEASDDDSTNAPVLCPPCDYVVPELAFCAHCGVAARAASRSSRVERRRHRPVPVTAPTEGR